jgi:hypothetical protein
VSHITYVWHLTDVWHVPHYSHRNCTEQVSAGTPELRVPGYADDTAIYISQKSMQEAAIRAVSSLSAVSGLKLNVKKSVVINLGRSDGEDAAAEPDAISSNGGKAEEESTVVQVCATTRYLGHIVGDSSNGSEAWEKAFKSLRLRLALVGAKTNTVQQRAQVAAVIIVPKVMYVARHAWPTRDIAQRADRSIRNYVWTSSFSEPTQASTGWMNARLAEQPVFQGGLGIPNIITELKALSAMRVGEWALTTKPQQQIIGDILQPRDTGAAEKLVPQSSRPTKCIVRTMWETGRKWAEDYFTSTTDDRERRSRTRRGPDSRSG